MEKQLLKFFLIFALFGLIVSCRSTPDKDFFFKEEGLQPGYEYQADILTIKKGFYLFWFIPFGFGDEQSAKAVMCEKSRKKFGADAAGIYRLKKVSEEKVAFFDWTPEVTMIGFVVKKK